MEEAVVAADVFWPPNNPPALGAGVVVLPNSPVAPVLAAVGGNPAGVVEFIANVGLAGVFKVAGGAPWLVGAWLNSPPDAAGVDVCVGVGLFPKRPPAAGVEAVFPPKRFEVG